MKFSWPKNKLCWTISRAWRKGRSVVIAFTFDRSDQDPEVGDDEEDKASDLKARDDARPVPPFVEGGRRKVCQGMGSAKIISQRAQEDSEDKAEEEALFGWFSSHRGSAP